MTDVSIVIVNYNTKQILKDCVKSILNNSFDFNYEIIIVDNASTDGSQKLIKDQFPQIIFVESNINLGFGLANNLGVEKAKGEYLFFLNSDTILTENSVKKLHNFYVENFETLRLGVIGAIMVDKNLNSNGFGSVFPTCKTEIISTLKSLPLIKKIMPRTLDINYSFKNDFFEVDYVLGADMFMSKKIFNDFGGFSKDFFMYYEESDLQKRMSKIGLKNYIITTTKIIHLEDGSGKQKNYSNIKRTIIHKSKNIYLKRNDSKIFVFYKIFDFLFLFLNLFNFKKYSLKENINYFKIIIKTYK